MFSYLYGVGFSDTTGQQASKRWFSRIPKLLPKSMVDGMERCLTGQEPDNYAEIDAQWLQDKGVAQRHLTKARRVELGPEIDKAKQDKAAAKMEDKLNEIRRLHAAGMSKRDLMSKFNATKYPEIKSAIDAIFQS